MNNDKNIFVGIGMPKTGITSLSRFIEKLNYKCFQFPCKDKIYEACLNYNNIDKMQFPIFDYVDAITDIPCTLIYKIIDRTYINAKFIYSYRNVNDWIDSIEYQMNKFLNKKESISNMNRYDKKNMYDILKIAFGTVRFNKNRYKDVYNRYNDDVMNYFKNKNNFIYYDLNDDDKISKICNFMGKKEFDKLQFPVLNKRG